MDDFVEIQLTCIMHLRLRLATPPRPRRTAAGIGSGVAEETGDALVVRGQNEWGCSWEIPRYYHDPRRQRPDYFLSLPWVLGSP